MVSPVKAVNKTHQSISELVKLGVKSSIHPNLSEFKKPESNNKTILITQYHESLNKSRNLEIIESIKKKHK
jgi:hypothetical protein